MKIDHRSRGPHVKCGSRRTESLGQEVETSCLGIHGARDLKELVKESSCETHGMSGQMGRGKRLPERLRQKLDEVCEMYLSGVGARWLIGFYASTQPYSLNRTHYVHFHPECLRSNNPPFMMPHQAHLREMPAREPNTRKCAT